MYKKIILIFIYLSTFEIGLSQTQFYSNHSNSILQNLKDISNNTILVSFNYEPSEEDFATLAYYRFKFGVKTYSVFLTRGEGSENLLDNELYQELGAVRTKEERAASDYIDCKPFFLNLFDYGFTRNKDELISKWGEVDSILAKMVYIIRKLKPDVIIFGNDRKDVFSIEKNKLIEVLLPIAIKKAADTNEYISQISDFYIKPWQVKQFFELSNADNKNQKVIIPVSEIDHERNISYNQIEYNSKRYFKTLFNERNLLLQKTKEKYYRSFLPEKSTKLLSNNLFSNVNLEFEGWKIIKKYITELNKIKMSDTVNLLKIITKFEDEVDKIKKEMLFNKKYDILKDRVLIGLKILLSDLKVNILNIKIDKYVSEKAVCQRQQFLFQIDSMYNLPIGLTSVYFLNYDPKDWVIMRGTEYKNGFKMIYHVPFQIVTPEKILITYPEYTHQYNAFSYEYPLKYAIIHSSKDRKYSFQYFDYFDFDVTPKADFRVTPSIVYINKKHTFNYELTHYLNDEFIKINPKVSNTELGTSKSDIFDFKKKYDHKEGKIEFTINDSLKNGKYELFFTVGKPIYSRVILKKFDCKINPNIKIGVISTNNKGIENFLKDLEVDYQILDKKLLSTFSLNQFSTIIVCESEINKEEVVNNLNILIQYVKDGGNLIILNGQKSRFFSPYELNLSPFKLKISENCAVQEKSNIKILDEKHPFFNYPNNITNSDWTGWMQERGLYFAEEYSNEFKELISTSDKGEKDLRSAILFTNYGKGSITYTSLSIERQLNSVVEGAYRLFSNMISMNNNK